MKKSSDRFNWDAKDWEYHNKPHEEWTEIEWENVFNLYNATQAWELNDPIQFDEFKNLITSNPVFARLNKLLPGMQYLNYSPWD